MDTVCMSMFLTKSRQPAQQPATRSTPTDAPLGPQFKARLDRLVCDTRAVLDDFYEHKWGLYKEPGKIVKRLDSQLRSLILMRSLMELDLATGQARQLPCEEIDFIRNAELFLDQLGAQRLREAKNSLGTLVF